MAFWGGCIYRWGQKLLEELGNRFPLHAIMDALGVVYLQYWLQNDAEENFKKHFSVLEFFYCEPKYIEVDKQKKLVPLLLDGHSLQTQ